MENNIPTLGDTTVINTAAIPAATFAAFKPEDRISFIRAYDPKVQVIEGYRHAVIRYRNTDNKTVSKPAQMVTIPQVKIGAEYAVFESTEHGKKLETVLTAALEDEQDNMIRAMIENKQSYVGWDSLSVSATLDSLTAVRMSQRLTKEQIENWFKVAAKDVCTQRATQIAEEKQYNPEQTAKQVAGTLNAYSELACKLAAPVPNIGQQQAIALKNLLTTGKLDDDMAKVLLQKLEQILNPKVIENADL